MTLRALQNKMDAGQSEILMKVTRDFPAFFTVTAATMHAVATFVRVLVTGRTLRPNGFVVKYGNVAFGLANGLF